jgi:H+/gluconate symporter-like permease
MSNLEIVLILFGSIGLLLFMILKLKIQTFLALLVTSIFLGLITGMSMNSIITSVLDGMGSTFGFVATIVGIGAILGQMLDSSGGAESLAHYLTKRFGRDKAHLVLILSNTVSGVWASSHGLKDHFVIRLLAFLGHPVMALLIVTFIAICAMGIRRGFCWIRFFS